MANPTTNYGFVLPTPTDLVTDLPADFDVALQGVDTRLKALQPGTTLGDLAYSSATANTNTRLAIGTANQVLAVNSGGTAPEWTTIASGLSAATPAEMETASSTTVATTPGRQQYHPSAAKFWVKFNGTGTPAIGASYNFTSITDLGAGNYTMIIATDFSSGNYAILATCDKLSGASSTSTLMTCCTYTVSAGQFGLQTFNLLGTLSDSDGVYVAGFGDQA